MLNKIDLDMQYKGFNLCFWVMLSLAMIFATIGDVNTAVLLGTLGMVSGVIALTKLVLRNQNMFLDNQRRIEDKLDVLLEEGVQ
jgi:tetrahydromethanopterin S-methyltransferase subunit E